MKLITKSLIGAALGIAALSLLAQDAAQPGGPEAGPRRGGAPAIVTALDANHDGVIDAGEIANAANALLTLDKNGDGQLTADELRPAKGPGGRGPGEGGRRGPKPGSEGQ